jgi:hypothetical protein
MLVADIRHAQTSRSHASEMGTRLQQDNAQPASRRFNRGNHPTRNPSIHTEIRLNLLFVVGNWGKVSNHGFHNNWNRKNSSLAKAPALPMPMACLYCIKNGLFLTFENFTGADTPRTAKLLFQLAKVAISGMLGRLNPELQTPLQTLFTNPDCSPPVNNPHTVPTGVGVRRDRVAP